MVKLSRTSFAFFSFNGFSILGSSGVTGFGATPSRELPLTDAFTLFFFAAGRTNVGASVLLASGAAAGTDLAAALAVLERVPIVVFGVFAVAVFCDAARPGDVLIGFGVSELAKSGTAGELFDDRVDMESP